MSRTVYAVASGKGGVGKTTTAVNLGAALAADGHDVVIVDTDLGMANLAGFLDFDQGEATLHEVLAGEADLDDAIYEAPGGLDVVPSSTDIEAFARAKTAGLGAVVAELRERYDFVLLDTGAGISHDTVLPLGLADEVLLVSTPDVASVSDTAKTADLAERVGSTVAGAVLTKKSSNILDATDVGETLGTDVLAVVPEDEAVPTSIDAGRPLAVFAPTSPAALTYEALAAVLTAEDPEEMLAELDEAGPAEDVGSESADEDFSADVVPFGDQGDVLDEQGGDPLDTARPPESTGDEYDVDADAEDLLGLDPDADRQFLAGIDDEDAEIVDDALDSDDALDADAPSDLEGPSGPDDPSGQDDPLAAGETPDRTDDSDFADVDPDDATSETPEDASAGVDAAAEEPADGGVGAYIEPAEPDSGSAAGDSSGASGADDRDEDPAEDALSTVLGDEEEEKSEGEGKEKEGGLFGKLSGMFR